MPLYLFQLSAHSRPVTLQRKPRYSTLAKRKGGGCFREGVTRMHHSLDLSALARVIIIGIIMYYHYYYYYYILGLRALLQAWVAAADPQVEA